MPEIPSSLCSRCVAEALGTFVLVFFGCGAVHVAVLDGALSGLWQVAIVWGVAIMLASYVFGGISGAHINPAITSALAVWGRFPGRDVLPYIASQVVGATLAGAVLFGLFHPFLTEKENRKGVVRGQPGSELTAMCYGEYFPNPGELAAGAGRYDPVTHQARELLVSEPAAFVAVVRTLYAEADGVALPEPDPANPDKREFAWMTVHQYVPDKAVTYPFQDWKSLEK